jgi:hypothetical protein
MLQRDYLLRMTEMLAAALSKILFNIEKKDYAKAENEIVSAAKTIIGLDLKMINILNIEDIMKLMKTSDLYAGRCIVSAELMNEYGFVIKMNGNETESINIYQKSLRLYLEALLAKEIPEPGKYFSKVNELILKLKEVEISDELNKLLIDYYELSGQYSKAEDIIFQLLENQNTEIKNKAVSFYKKLHLKSDEDLIAGNLSREEINESLEEISQM